MSTKLSFAKPICYKKVQSNRQWLHNEARLYMCIYRYMYVPTINKKKPLFITRFN